MEEDGAVVVYSACSEPLIQTHSASLANGLAEVHLFTFRLTRSHTVGLTLMWTRSGSLVQDHPVSFRFTGSQSDLLDVMRFALCRRASVLLRFSQSHPDSFSLKCNSSNALAEVHSEIGSGAHQVM